MDHFAVNSDRLEEPKLVRALPLLILATKEEDSFYLRLIWSSYLSIEFVLYISFTLGWLRSDSTACSLNKGSHSLLQINLHPLVIF